MRACAGVAEHLPFADRRFERIVAVDSGSAVVSKRGGIVDSVDAARIVVRVHDAEAGEGAAKPRSRLLRDGGRGDRRGGRRSMDGGEPLGGARPTLGGLERGGSLGRHRDPGGKSPERDRHYREARSVASSGDRGRGRSRLTAVGGRSQRPADQGAQTTRATAPVLDPRRLLGWFAIPDHLAPSSCSMGNSTASAGVRPARCRSGPATRASRVPDPPVWFLGCHVDGPRWPCPCSPCSP